MECPYCGFYHLSPQERCARCKKPLQPDENEKERTDSVAAGDEGVPEGPDESRAEDFSKEHDQEDRETEEDEILAAGFLEEEDESEDGQEADGAVPLESPASADEAGPVEQDKLDAFFVGEVSESEEDEENEDDEDSREIEDYPQAASYEYSLEAPREESTGELVNRALREIDLDLSRMSRKSDSERDDGPESSEITDGPVLATLLSESDEQELTGSVTEEDYTEPGPRKEENTGPPPEDISPRRVSSLEGPQAPAKAEKEEQEQEESDGRFACLNFEGPPQENVPLAEDETFRPKPSPQSLFGEEGWGTPESFPWQEEEEDDDDEVSRIEIKGDESFSALREDDSGLLGKKRSSKTGRRKKGMQAVSRKDKPVESEEEISVASGDLLLRRVGAGAVDVAIWFLFGVLLYGGAVLLAGPLDASGGEWFLMALFPVVIMSFVLALVYGSLFSSMTGSTPGMMVCGLRMEDEQGERPGLQQAFARTGLYLACLLPLGLGFLTMFAGGPDKSWFERATGTRVVKA